MTKLGPVLTEQDLPVAELMAARLDGELAALDGAWTPIDEIEQPRHRALSLALRLPVGVVIEQRSAAWVWGAVPCAPRVHQLCIPASGPRLRAGSGWAPFREVVIDSEEIWTIGPARITSPLRTVVDLARFAPTWNDDVRDIARTLLRFGEHAIDDCLESMEGRRNLPSKRRAKARLWALRGAPRPDYAELTRYTS